MAEFNSWREREEEITYTTYVRDTQRYQPKLSEGIILITMHQVL